MRFFKHFTDAHRGKSLQRLYDAMGHAGLSCYWILVELCAEKIEEKMDEKNGERITEDDCRFEFHERILRQCFRLSRTNVRRWLDHGQTMELLEFNYSGDLIKIYMPKILKCLERRKKKDVKHPAERRQKNVLDKDKDKEKEYIEAIAAVLPLPPPTLPVQALVDVWNQNCGNLPRVRELNDDRVRKAKARLKQKPELEYWREVAKRLADSDFCNGENKSGWRADFDFFVSPKCHIKAIEGAYDNKKSAQRPFMVAE